MCIFDEIDKVLNQYNNTYHSTVKMKPADVNSSTYSDFGTENNDKDHTKASECKNIFAKGYTLNWSEEVFVIKTKLKAQLLLVILIVKKLLERFTKKNCKKQIKKCLGSKR